MNKTPTVLLQTLCWSHSIIAPMIGIITVTLDTVTSVDKNILKTGIPPERALLTREEGQDRVWIDSEVAKTQLSKVDIKLTFIAGKSRHF